jgi:Short C-terminal domain
LVLVACRVEPVGVGVGVKLAARGAESFKRSSLTTSWTELIFRWARRKLLASERTAAAHTHGYEVQDFHGFPMAVQIFSTVRNVLSSLLRIGKKALVAIGLATVVLFGGGWLAMNYQGEKVLGLDGQVRYERPIQWWALFIAGAIVIGLVIFWQLVSALRDKAPEQVVNRIAETALTQVEQLAGLARLHASGALTAAEFEAAKRSVLWAPPKA